MEEAGSSLFHKYENREMKKFVSGHTAYKWWSWDSGSKIYILTCYTCPRKGEWPLTLKELREGKEAGHTPTWGLGSRSPKDNS